MDKDELAPITVLCPHDGCLTIVAYHELDDQKAACPCGYTEVGCIFTASLVELLLHLNDVHKVQVHRLSYGQPMECIVTMPLSSFPPSMVIIYGDDATVFNLIIGELDQASDVSSVCVKAASCSWPWYRVKLCATGSQSPTDYLMDTLNGVIEPTSYASPDSVGLEDLTFLTVLPRYITAADGQYGTIKVLYFCDCIDRMN